MFSKILPRTFPRAKDSLLVALNAEKRRIQLKPYKRLQFRFDPFRDDSVSIREFMVLLTGRKARRTNPKCTFRTDVLSDQTEPQIICQLGKELFVVYYFTLIFLHENREWKTTDS